MMDLLQRAHFFSSFDALKGFRELLKDQERVVVERRMLSEDDLEVLNRKIFVIEKGMMVTLEYFDNGDYVRKTGRVTKISLDEQYIQIVKTRISLKKIVDIQSDDIIDPFDSITEYRYNIVVIKVAHKNIKEIYFMSHT